jgi:hypothetical protein
MRPNLSFTLKMGDYTRFSTSVIMPSKMVVPD